MFHIDFIVFIMNKYDDDSHMVFLEILEKNNIEFIDFCFSDLCGRQFYITRTFNSTSSEMLKNGIPFDGSSIEGWCPINKSDMLLMPDISSVFDDKFCDYKTVKIICDVFDPHQNKMYSKDPRSVAKNALNFLKQSGIADEVFFGPELEFFLFDHVAFESGTHSSFYHIDDSELPTNNGLTELGSNIYHRFGAKNAYLGSSPSDNKNIRMEMVKTLNEIGVETELCHKEVAPCQFELGIKYGDIVTMSDNVQKYKHTIKHIAKKHNKTATFMPKPVFSDNGSGMHVHQSLWKNGQNLFESSESDLSEIAKYYIGGIIKHAKVINAFSNPTTNSYKRLVPGFEAPTKLTYSKCNRSVAIRIPSTAHGKATRIEVRFPDPSCNPYLTFSAMLMAGIDGIKNKIMPPKPTDNDLFTSNSKEDKKFTSVASSLEEAINNLNSSKANFLKENNVFTDDLIKSYIDLKQHEIDQYNQKPHPVEFEMYYTC